MVKSRTPHPTMLSHFHPYIREWFSTTIGAPTNVQASAWAEISAGRHVLVSAPTGSGKTLTAFLWAIHQLISGEWPAGHTRILYVSPMKALNNDIRRNLLAPLAQLKNVFQRHGGSFPEITVQTRSGDTPQADRRKMLRHPPEILITTPESLNIMVSSKSSRLMLSGVATVILDEIHAVAASKRGVHMMSAVERLVPLCGEFQRIALSATVKPLQVVADVIGGYQIHGDEKHPAYQKRPVSVIAEPMAKKYDVAVRFPADARENLVDQSWWPALIEAFSEIVRKNTATLLFTNSRRLSEKVARLINETMNGDDGKDISVYAHHGSLSKEIRFTVEQKLKNGKLKAIVATNSLELGIDIGHLSQVVLVQAPRSIASAIQRIGRAGHGVAETSRGVLFPTHGRDLIHAAVMARSVLQADIEPVVPVICPLDVLAQVILAMTGVETWDMDELFAMLRTVTAFHDLSRRQFDLVLDMLGGRYADTRLRELKPRVMIDRIDNTVTAKPGSLMLVYMAGGTIPDRGYYDLRLQDSKSKIGELDEEFVWERRVGETFALGAQAWRIKNITANDVEVVNAASQPGIFPFWKAEAQNRDFHFSQKIGHFLEYAAQNLNSFRFEQDLHDIYVMDGPAAKELIYFLKLQIEITGADLPHRHHLLVEHFSDPLNTADSKQVILHTLWGGRINRAYGMALSAAWEGLYGYHLELFCDDDCVLLLLPHAFNTDDVLRMVTSVNVDTLLRSQLEKTGFFGARFRENAGRALLLPKVNFKKRMPLWLNRLRAKKLKDAVSAYDDFPILLETWRTCLQDEFDLENLKLLLDELAGGEIAVSQVYTTTASPFSKGLIWQQTNMHMYADDTPQGDSVSGLNDALIKDIVYSSRLRPRIPKDMVTLLEQKLHRTAVGYAPGTAAEVLDWVRERYLIPETEWQTLIEAVKRDHGVTMAALLAALEDKIVSVKLEGAEVRVIAAVETLPLITESVECSRDMLDIAPITESSPAFYERLHANWDICDSNRLPEENGRLSRPQKLSRLCGDWLSFYGPVPPERLKHIFGIGDDMLNEIISTLTDTGQILYDVLTDESDSAEICDVTNLEILLRMIRKSRRPAFKPLPVTYLPLYLAGYQGVIATGDTVEDLQERLDQLMGYVLPANAWEEYVLPARLPGYQAAWMDSVMQSTDVIWFGNGTKKVGFCFEDEYALFAREMASDPSEIKLLPGVRGRYTLLDIMDYSGVTISRATRELWDLVWRQRITNDSFVVLRNAIVNRFSASFPQVSPRSGRQRLSRWKTSRPVQGNWYVLPCPEDTDDALEREELNKERVRQLFRRYGILFKELLEREIQVLSWGRLFRTLRLMELSGEILSGQFFEGIPGVQFIKPDALRVLQRPLPENAVYWLNAADPASSCGIRLPGLKRYLPSRQATTYLVFHGTQLMLTAAKTGKQVTIHVTPDYPYLTEGYACFKMWLSRQFAPLKSLRIETINGDIATESEYADTLKAFGFKVYMKTLELRKFEY